MDGFEIGNSPEPRRSRRPSTRVWNILTAVVLVMILCAVSVFYLIFTNPNSFLNPFPPPTLLPSPTFPTATMTLRFTLVPSWTPTSTPVLATDTPVPTHTPLVTNTPEIGAEPGATPAPGVFAFELQPGSPSAIDGTTFHPDLDCNWTGVAGQATSLNGEPVTGLFVRLGGSIPGDEAIDQLSMTGWAEQYGAGGFEFTVADYLVASEGTLWIQLLDQQNLPLSDKVYFNTYEDCQRNLIIIYFDQVQ